MQATKIEEADPVRGLMLSFDISAFVIQGS